MGGGQVKSLKLNIPLPNQDISILFEDSIYVEAPPPMGGGASTYIESSNRIEISRLGQGIFDF